MITFRHPYSAFTIKADLRSQELGDTIETPNPVSLRRTMSGSPITTIRTTLIEKYNLTIKSICDLTEFLSFIDAAQGAEIFMGTGAANWKGHITTRPLPIITEITGKGFTFTFEGIRYTDFHILKQDGDYLLLQTGGRILREDIT